jgi:hypothetical protein
VSGHRGISEHEVVNSYTYRQAITLVEYLVREKFMVVTEVATAFFSKQKPDQPSSTPAPSKSVLPSWYQPRSNARIKVIDLDGPMAALQPYIGKSAVRKGASKRARR